MLQAHNVKIETNYPGQIDCEKYHNIVNVDITTYLMSWIIAFLNFGGLKICDKTYTLTM